MSEPNLLFGTVEKTFNDRLRIISLSGTIQENLPVDTIVAGMNITLSRQQSLVKHSLLLKHTLLLLKEQN